MDFAELGKQLVTTAAFAALGLAVMAIAFVLWEWITPYSIKEELTEKKNTAIAVVMAGMLIGISIIIAGALLG